MFSGQVQTCVCYHLFPKSLLKARDASGVPLLCFLPGPTINNLAEIFPTLLSPGCRKWCSPYVPATSITCFTHLTIDWAGQDHCRTYMVSSMNFHCSKFTCLRRFIYPIGSVYQLQHGQITRVDGICLPWGYRKSPHVSSLLPLKSSIFWTLALLSSLSSEPKSG